MDTNTVSAIGTGVETETRAKTRNQDVLAHYWLELATGRAKVSRVYSDASCHHVELVAGHEPPRPRDLDVLVPVLLGQQQKVVADDTHRSVSNVATIAARGLHTMGMACRTKDTPMILVMMVHAFHRPGALRGVRVRSEEVALGHTLVSTPRPDAQLAALLSVCQCEVLRLRIDGLTYDDIARKRNTSVRTVANQIASAYAKLHTSGRLALCARLLGESSGVVQLYDVLLDSRGMFRSMITR